MKVYNIISRIILKLISKKSVRITLLATVIIGLLLNFTALHFIGSNRLSHILLINIFTIILPLLIVVEVTLVNCHKDIARLINDIAEGNFKLQIPVYGQDEVAATINSINELSSNYRKLFTRVIEASINTASFSEELIEFVDSNNTEVSQISALIKRVVDYNNSYAENINDSIGMLDNISNKANEIESIVSIASQASKKSREVSQQGVVSVEKTLIKFKEVQATVESLSSSINELGVKSGNIIKIVNSIRDIAHRTNLLALNASIESARAGEAGKGFRVVAEEIGKLSHDTSSSLEDIESILKEIAESVKESSIITDENKAITEQSIVAVEKSKDILEEINTNSKTTEEKVQNTFNILGALKESISYIVKSVNSISAKTMDTVACTSESFEAMKILENNTDQIFNSIKSLDKMTTELHKYIVDDTISKVLKKQINLLKEHKNLVQLASTECKNLANKYSIDNFQITDKSGKVILSSEKESINLNLFDIYPPYKEYFNGSKSEYLITPIVKRTDGIHATYAASRSQNNQYLIVVEYKVE